ncbi:hypothetical protein D3C71_1505030 [compost metagenome]
MGIKRGEVGLWLPAARHHADIVAAHQGIQARHARQRGFGCYQPKLGAVAQGVFQVTLDAGFDHNAAQILAQADALYGAYFHPLITYRSTPGDNARRGLEINGHRGTAFLEIVIDQPPRDQQGNKRQ